MKRLVMLVAMLAALPLYAEGTGTIEYIQSLAGKPAATVSDAVILFAMQEGSRIADFSEARDLLIGKGILKQREYNPADPLGRGLLAGMTARMLDLRGSLLFKLTGADRYACSACSADGIMKGDISEYDTISGPELIEIIGAVSSRGANNE
jgi:hypothetical protein